MGSTKDIETGEVALVRRSCTVAALYLAISLALLTFGHAHPALAHVSTAALGAPLAVYSVALALRHLANAHDRQERLARSGWLSMAASSVLFSVGECLWAGHSQFGLRSSAADAAHGFWLAVNPLAVVGAGLILAGARRVNLGFILDCAASAAASALALWALASQSSDLGEKAPVAARALSSGYPALGAVSVFAIVVIMGLAVRARRERLALMTLATAVAVSMLASVLFSTDILQHQFAWVRWYEAGFFTARALTLVAIGLRIHAHSGSNSPDESPGPLAGIVQTAIPWVVAAVVALTAAGAQFSVRGLKDPPLVLGSFVLASILLARQAVALAEHRRLTDALRRAGETLEADVHRRTEQLALHNDQMASLHQLLVAINDSLDERTVLKAAQRHAGEAFQADIFGAWHLPAGDAPKLQLVHLSGLAPNDPWARRLARVREVPETLQRVLARRRTSSGELHIRYVRLVSQHQCFGMIGIARWNKPYSISDEALIESMGRAVGGALHNARRFAAARDAADRDPMTGLLNHRAIHERLQALLSEAVQTGSCGAVLMVDVNDFKVFNDAYGHQIGDKVILQVAEALREVCGPDASLGRYGGDEFFAALPGRDRSAAQEVAESLRRRVANQPVIVVDGTPVAKTVSLAIGVAVYPDDSPKALEVLAHADSKLYQNKYQRQSAPGRRRTLPSSEPTFAFLDAMISAIDAKDGYTREHAEAVATYAQWLGQGLDLPDDRLDSLRTVALLHDIGKIGVPDEILCKPGVLDAPEFETMRRHPVTGSLIITAVPGLSPLAPAIRAHHERWDGRGYPDGVTGESIPFEARVLAIAGAFAAMTSDRPYRKARPWQDALDELVAGSGNQFDPSLVAVFVAAVRLRAEPRRAA